MDLDPLEDLDSHATPPSPVERPYHLLDEHSVPIPKEEPHEDLVSAITRAKELSRKVVVVKRSADGTNVPMSYTGPGGWMGPKAKYTPHPAYGVPPRRRHTEGS